MKELSTEEKAKRYDEAINTIRNLVNAGLIHEGAAIQVFPEIAEIVDERIWKVLRERIIRYDPNNEILIKEEGISQKQFLAWLEKQKQAEQKLVISDDALREGITHFGITQYQIDNWLKKYVDVEKQDEKKYVLKSSKDEDVRKFVQYIEKEAKSYEINLPNRGYDIYAFAKDILAWLEKQGEQKPIDPDNLIQRVDALADIVAEQKLTDKVEPKFKVGDWVVNKFGDVWHIDSFDRNYQVSNGDKYCYFTIEKQNEMHIWTIQDAKDGDILAAHECYVIFKEIDGLNIKCYCTYHYIGCNPSFYVDTLQNKTAFYPATKEQRETLERAMTNAGYAFDFEKKELKKIEQKPMNKVEPMQEWSEDDEEMLEELLNYCDTSIQYNGIKSQQAIKWKKRKEWLKSLRPQSRWKPDSSMLICLEYAIKHINKDSDKRILSKLLEQLKKL